MNAVVSVAGDEIGLGQHGLQEGDVGRHAPHPELGHGPPGPGHGLGEGAPPARQFDEQRIEMGRNVGAQIGAPVEAHAMAAGGTVGRDAAGVGPETVRRVLGGDPALQGGAGDDDVVLA